MKRIFAILLSLMMMLSMAMLAGCSGGSESDDAEAPAAEETAETAEDAVEDGAEYGYAGTDPVDAAVYDYLGDELSENYDDADANIPVVTVIDVEEQDSETLVWGDFWIINYNIEGDTLKMVSGGAYPGVMHLVKDGDEYEVKSMDVVADGSNYEESAREIFGDKYDSFIKVSSDNEQREETRAEIIANYVKARGLSVTKYQDEGWDPVELYQ